MAFFFTKNSIVFVVAIQLFMNTNGGVEVYFSIPEHDVVIIGVDDADRALPYYQGGCSCRGYA